MCTRPYAVMMFLELSVRGVSLYYAMTKMTKRCFWHSGERGATLLEVLLYSAILAVFLGAAFLVVNNVLLVNRDLTLRHELIANQELVGERLRWAARQAERIEFPAPGGELFSEMRFRMYQADGSPAVFSFSDGRIFLSLASSTPRPLTNSRVLVTNFRARHISNGQIASAAELTFSLRDAGKEFVSSTVTYLFSLPVF